MTRIISGAQTALFRARRRSRVLREERLFIESARGVRGAEAFSGLHRLSLAASSVTLDDSVPRHITLILPEVHPSSIFAGIRTALEIGSGLSNRSGLPLRVLSLSAALKPVDQDAVRALLSREFGLERSATTSILPITALAGLSVNSNDLWIGTHWTTAHPLDVAARLGVIRPEQVVYIVQDYEPGFYPWSTDFALARSTYNAGFTTVVNSTPLASYLKSHEPLEVDDGLIFAPSLDFGRLREAAGSRVRGPAMKVLFYGRPSKPRNLFNIGISALRLASATSSAEGTVFTSAGETHGPVDLAHGRLKAWGKLPWNRYFEELATSDVVLSLQHSPHPSHPPLDAVVSGAFAVTNELEGTRAELHPRLLTAEPDATALARRVTEALDLARSTTPAAYDEAFVSTLGRPLDSVVGRVAELTQ